MVPDNCKKYELSKYAQVRHTVDSFIFTKIDSRRRSYVHVKHLLCKLLKGKGEQGKYESFSDVGEIRVYFASKILTPCRMH